MITILHGDHHVQSRAKLGELLTAAAEQHTETLRLDAKKLTMADLESTLGSDSLFGTDRIVVIDELHSLPVGKRRTDLIKQVQAATTAALILWEKKKLTATQLKGFAGATVHEYKLTSVLFKWLDALSGSAANKPTQLKLLHQVLEQEDAFFVFTMLIRQIRMLLQAKDGGKLTGAPFMIQKLQAQAKNFSMEQLLAIHAKLLTLDLNQKTSRSILDLSKELHVLIWTW